MTLNADPQHLAAVLNSPQSSSRASKYSDVLIQVLNHPASGSRRKYDIASTERFVASLPKDHKFVGTQRRADITIGVNLFTIPDDEDISHVVSNLRVVGDRLIGDVFITEDTVGGQGLNRALRAPLRNVKLWFRGTVLSEIRGVSSVPPVQQATDLSHIETIDVIDITVCYPIPEGTRIRFLEPVFYAEGAGEPTQHAAAGEFGTLICTVFPLNTLFCAVKDGSDVVFDVAGCDFEIV